MDSGIIVGDLTVDDVADPVAAPGQAGIDVKAAGVNFPDVLTAMRRMLGWMVEGKLRPLVAKRYPLADTALALNDMADRKVTGKVVIVP
jgi:NADPH:quinone reductase-like Zn-dependent oxidoreductase